jgi:hypothetical protein
MAGRYERVCTLHCSFTTLRTAMEMTDTRPQVNAHEDDYAEYEIQSPSTLHAGHQLIPGSPPPSFHSRASSPQRRNEPVDPTLADAFDDDEASDDEADDRQRLVRQNTAPSQSQVTPSSTGDASTNSGSGTYQTANTEVTSSRAGRVIGSGFASDGVFANMSARPERTDSEKDEQPPVGFRLGYLTGLGVCLLTLQTDIRASRGRCCPTVLGDDHPRSWPGRP